MGQLTQPVFEEGRSQGLAQGIERGIAQGIEQGIATGQVRVLIRLLTRRFGSLPEQVRERIASADLPTLDRWSDLVLEAPDLDTLLNGPTDR